MAGRVAKKALWKNWYVGPRFNRFLALILGCSGGAEGRDGALDAGQCAVHMVTESPSGRVGDRALNTRAWSWGQ